VQISASLHLEAAMKFGTRFSSQDQNRVRRSTAIGVSESARELLTEFQSGTSGAAGQTKNFISKVSNHRKNKGFELLPGLEPWAVPATRQETSDMGFTFAIKALPAGKARRVSRVR